MRCSQGARLERLCGLAVMTKLCVAFDGLVFFSSRRRHTRLQGDWSSDVCSSDLQAGAALSFVAGCSLRVREERWPPGAMRRASPEADRRASPSTEQKPRRQPGGPE